ncbi:protein RTE1-HOMOLOG [Beta vulgaris subsp. vulgaris]|uniref:protein RTE1-HOMOLOG n=1 Tax=Beta vulgaris subsp. vulgaris TaxID=3555 RepID=UPI002036C9EC|nr:protein RTE1-HOMOLOG [Beta vulgaris subsp. vulgaris]
MATDMDTEEQLMIGESSPQPMQIDPKRDRFPFCVVWTPLPVLSWLIPFIGHIGICREDGVILDFAGPNFVCVDNFAFGAVTRYLQIDAKLCRALSFLVSCRNGDQLNQNGTEGDIYTWDDALRKSTQEFQHHSYSLLTCNCHSFVANNLNRLGFSGGRWNVVSLAVLILFKGRWVDKGSIVKSYLPFLIVFPLGLAFGGWTFLQFWGMFVILLVSWFLLGSYCLKGLIQL